MSFHAAVFRTTNETIATFFSRPTRFANRWEDHNVEEAIDFAARWNIDYQSPPANNLTLPNGQHVTIGGGQLDVRELRRANAFCNHLTELRHLRDSHHNTGTKLMKYKQKKWYLATRGERLRTLSHQDILWRLEARDESQRVRILEVAMQRPVGREFLYTRMALCKARVDMVLYRAILDTIEQVERMLGEEEEEGWDWKVGLRAQLDARDRLYLVEIENLSDVARDSFWRAAQGLMIY